MYAPPPSSPAENSPAAAPTPLIISFPCFRKNTDIGLLLKFSQNDIVKTRGIAPRPLLLSEVELRDDRTVALDVLVAKIRQQAAAMANHLQKPAAGMMILLVLLQMLGEIRDARGQHGNLDFRRTRVALVDGILLDKSGFFFFGKHVCILLLFVILQ